MKRARRAALNFDPHALPPGITWQIEVELARQEAPEFLEHLESLCVERRGARFYFLKTEDLTECRFEWTARVPGVPSPARLVLLFAVRSETVGPFRALLTTNELVGAPWRDAPAFTSTQVRRAQAEVQALVRRAVELTRGGESVRQHCVEYMQCPHGLPMLATVALGDAVKLMPAVVLLGTRGRGDCISAVVHSIIAPTRQAAAVKAKAAHAIVCALASLTANARFLPYTPHWTTRERAVQFVPSMDLEGHRLYPKHAAVPVNASDPDLVTAFGRVEAAFRNLSSTHREVFTQALLAYAGALEVASRQGTVAAVSLIAGLNLLASERVQECAGTLSCSECGPIPLKHKERGDAAAILELLGDLLSVQKASPGYKRLKALIRGVYSAQRSGFVHAAQLRHGEHDQGVLTAVPGPVRQRNELLEHADQLDSLFWVYRRALLAWLERGSKEVLDLGGFAPGAEILSTRSFDAALHISRQMSTIRMTPYAEGELEANRELWQTRQCN